MDKFDELVSVSKQIVSSYMELVTLSSDDRMHDLLVIDIRELVLEEYQLLSSMSFEEINFFVKLANEIEDDTISPRIKHKLIDRREVLLNNVIMPFELQLKGIPSNIKFCICDVIMSMISIEVIKKIKNKIYSAICYGDSDELFIEALKDELNYAKVDCLFSLTASEILTLYNNCDIDEVPMIDVKLVERKIMELCDYELSLAVDATVSYYAKVIIDRFAAIERIGNNPRDVFYFLSMITYLEVLLSYMNDSTRENVSNYCSSVSNKNNVNSINFAKKLIRVNKNNFQKN